MVTCLGHSAEDHFLRGANQTNDGSGANNTNRLAPVATGSRLRAPFFGFPSSTMAQQSSTDASATGSQDDPRGKQAPNLNDGFYHHSHGKYDFYGRLLEGVHPPRDHFAYWASENLKPWFPGVWTRLQLVERPRERPRSRSPRGSGSMSSSNREKK